MSPPALHDPTASPGALQAAHPALKRSPDLQLFLEASETEFAIEVSRTQVDDPVAVQARARNWGWGLGCAVCAGVQPSSPSPAGLLPRLPITVCCA